MAKKHVVEHKLQINPCIIDQPLNKITGKHPAIGWMSRSYMFNPTMFDHLDEKLPARLTELANVPEKITEITKQYGNAVKILDSFGGESLPICYSLQPKIKELRKDDTSVAKFGGRPDVSNSFWLRYRDSIPSYDKKRPVLSMLQAIQKGWPRCGACHRYMAFISQFSLGVWPLAIHLATAKEQNEYAGRKLWVSSLGASEQHYESEMLSPTWWYTFMCSDAAVHFDNPNYDACVIFDNGPSAKKDRHWEQAKEAVDEFYKKDLAGDSFLSIPNIQEIKDFAIMMDVDPGLEESRDWENNSKIDDIMRKNPKVFNHGELPFFGAPRSQQTERRFWADLGTTPRRMIPFISWNQEEHDTSYQIYGDTYIRQETRTMFCKVDGSST